MIEIMLNIHKHTEPQISWGYMPNSEHYIKYIIISDFRDQEWRERVKR